MKVQNITNSYVNSNNRQNSQAPAFKQLLSQVKINGASKELFAPQAERLKRAAWTYLTVNGFGIYKGEPFLLKDESGNLVRRVFNKDLRS
jgi:hypothetical protein